MNLDKYIRIQLMILSKKYDISVVEVTKGQEDRVSKSYTVNFKEKQEGSINQQMHFGNKKNLVSWLLCLD